MKEWFSAVWIVGNLFLHSDLLEELLAGQIEEIFDQRGGNILESYQLFDIYEGAQIEKGFKSMAYSLVFRAHDKTLGENEISAAMKKIMNGLNGLGIELRS